MLILISFAAIFAGPITPAGAAEQRITISAGRFAGTKVDAGRPVLTRRYDPKTGKFGAAGWGSIVGAAKDKAGGAAYDVRGSDGRVARFSAREIVPEASGDLPAGTGTPKFRRGQAVSITGQEGENYRIEALFAPNVALLRSKEGGAELLKYLSQLSSAGPVPSPPLPDIRLDAFYQLVSSEFDLKPTVGSGAQLNFRPAQSTYVGVGAGYKWLSASYSFSIPASSDIRASEGTSQYRDLRLNYYSRRFAAELSYNKFTGYLLDNSSVLSAATLNGQTYYKLPNLTAEGYGATFFYVFSPDVFSLPAGNDYSEIEEESAGSFLVSASFRRQAVHNDSAIIPAELQSQFGTEGSLTSYLTLNYAAGPGYGYFWRPRWGFIGESFFVAPLISLDLGYESISEDISGGTLQSGVFGLDVHVRFSLGWNKPGFFVILNVLADSFTGSTSAIELQGLQQSTELLAGVRF